MTFSDWLRGDSSPARHAMGIYPGQVQVPASLPPDDQPTGEPLTLDTCAVCPSPAVVALMRVITFTHRQWATYEAASVVERQACRHHADEALSAPDSEWFEAAARPVQA